MNDINQDITRMIVEMRELGKLPAPCKGGSHNNLLRYNKLRDRILDKFLSAFDEGYRLKNSNRPPEGEEVRHGRWEFLGPNRLIKSCMCGTCSVCHVRSKFISNIAICPTCGAHMDGEIKNETN